MDVFSEVTDALVILHKGGVYRQTTVYSRGDRFYAKQGAGFIRLLKHGQTTVPAVRWIDKEGFEL